MAYLTLILGFVILIVSGEFLVRSSSQMAVYFNIPKMIIGLIIVSFGTSAPELLVSLQAALKGHSEIAMGNVVGSNIANIALVLGLTAMIYPIVVKDKSIIFDWLVMFLSSVLLWALAYNDVLSLYEGLIFILALLLYIFYSIRHRPNSSLPDDNDYKTVALWKSLAFFISSIIGLYFGSQFLVDSASTIALNWGVSERVISVSIIAFGTSVPELATSIIAALKKEMEISIGNIIGSNIFNILSILGITASVQAISFEHSLVTQDIPFMIAVSVVLLLMILPLKNAQINRWKGLLLFSIYTGYIINVVIC